MISDTHPIPKTGVLAEKLKAMQPLSEYDLRQAKKLTRYRDDNHPITNIDIVNRTINQYTRYKSEPKDVWQKPSYTYAYARGDCEDIALLKWAILKDGLYKDLSLAIVRQKKDKQAHAVLFVDTKWYDDPHTYVLDNNTDKLLRVEDFLEDNILIYTTNGQTITYYNTEA